MFVHTHTNIHSTYINNLGIVVDIHCDILSNFQCVQNFIKYDQTIPQGRRHDFLCRKSESIYKTQKTKTNQKKPQKTLNENVEELEPLYTVGRSVKWCSHSGK